MYAIIEDSGTQIMVRKDDVIDVDLRKIPTGTSTLTFDRVLAIGAEDGTEAALGAPYLAKASVTAEILDANKRLPKTVMNKYSRRKGWRRHKGHRQGVISVKITEIAR